MPSETISEVVAFLQMMGVWELIPWFIGAMMLIVLVNRILNQ